jgi:2-polyprenyl-3-methyl-5-hydroxy-6-metoxy-1,4-benzoquinol methylase
VNHIDRRLNQTQESYAADDLETMKLARRYSAHVFNLFRPYIGRHVLEVGSGIGTMTAPLLELADSVVGLEPNPNCATRLEAALGSHPRFDLRVSHLEDCDPKDLGAHKFDTVFCLNVLEHIQDDALALRTFADVLIPGGNVLIFVPAVQAAYGPLDAELGHFRRYSKRTLEAAFTQAGLSLLTLRYTNPIGLAAWMLNARVLRSTAHSPTQVRVFDTLVAPWALPLERLIAPPIGLSLVAVGRKPDS